MDDLRTRLDRVRGRLPEDAEALTIFRQDSNAHADHEPRHRGQLRSRHAARDGREPDRPAARARQRRRGGDDQRRPAPPDPRRALQGKDRGARSARRPRHDAAPHGEPEHAARRSQPGRAHLPASQPVAVPEPRRNPQPRADDAKRRADLRARRRRGQGHDRGRPIAAAHQRPARRAPVGAEAVGHQHGAGRRRREGRDRSDQPARCRTSS